MLRKKKSEMKEQSPVFHRILLILALFNILMCPLLFVGGVFFPSSLGFLEPILCPSGMHLDKLTESIADARGNTTGIYLVCTDGDEQVDVSGKMLIILFGVGIVGVGLLVTWALISPSKKPDAPKITME
jgi:hypothetical protein